MEYSQEIYLNIGDNQYRCIFKYRKKSVYLFIQLMKDRSYTRKIFVKRNYQDDELSIRKLLNNTKIDKHFIKNFKIKKYPKFQKVNITNHFLKELR